MPPFQPLRDFEDIDKAVLLQWYKDARVAYQQLMTGAAVVEVMVDGYMTKFARANADQLFSYIYRLQAEIRGRDTPTGISITF